MSVPQQTSKKATDKWV